MARPITQAQRREDILRAAISLVGETDLAQLSLAQVADRLGVTTNAIRYYYSDIESLTAELAARSNTRFYEDRLALIDTIADHEKRLEAVIEAGLPTGPEDAEWRVIWMAILDAGFDLKNRSDVQAIYHRQVGLYEFLLAAGSRAGDFDLQQEALDIAMTLMSMEDYLGYRIAARDPLVSRKTALHLMKDFVRVSVRPQSLEHGFQSGQSRHRDS